MRTTEPGVEIPIPKELPFLESISWFDRLWRDLAPLDMLRRYESGWRWLGVTTDPSPEEWDFIRSLVGRFGSHLRIPPGTALTGPTADSAPPVGAGA